MKMMMTKEELLGRRVNPRIRRNRRSLRMRMTKLRLIPERPKVRNLISLFRPVGSSIVSFSVS